MGLTLVTAPTQEPVTLTSMKAFLRVTTSDHDDLLTSLIKAARQQGEKDTWRSFLTQTWDLFLTGFPSGNGPIRIPKPPCQSITTIKYLDLDGVQQTLNGANYVLDNSVEPALVYAAYNETWPATRAVHNAVEVRFVAGFGNEVSDVPEGLRNALKAYVAGNFENPESIITGAGVLSTINPQGYQFQINHYSKKEFA